MRRRDLLSCVFVATAVAFIAHAVRAAEWRLYRFPEDGFAIEFPGSPKIEVGNASGVKHITTARTYLLDRGEVVFGVDATLFAPSPAPVRAVQLLANAGELFQRSAKCSGYQERESKFLPVNAREFVFEQCHGRYLGLFRFYAQDDWFYQVGVMMTGGRPDDPDANRFVQSFRLLRR